MSKPSRFGNAVEEAAAGWDELEAQAVNAPRKDPIMVDEQNVPITVAEVLLASMSYFGADAVIVRDTEGKIWILPECVGEEDGLVSRHDVEPGMKFTVRLRRLAREETTVFVVK